MVFFPTGASMNVHPAKYLPLKTQWVRESRFCLSRQPCFARSAILKAFKSLKSILPSDLGVQRLSQDAHAIFLSLSLCPHQNWLTKEFNSLHKESESLKQLMVYVVVA